MRTSPARYRIVVQGQLGERRANWFVGFRLSQAGSRARRCWKESIA